MSDPAIAVKHVSKQFGETEVLRDISLEVPRGEVTCLIGPSGSGKSTLLRCMAFLEEATSGAIEIEGDPLGFVEGAGGRRRQTPAELRRVRSKVGMVFQQFNLWPHMTALGNVSAALRRVRKLPKAEAEDRAMRQLDKVGLKERAHHYPAQLSGGQQQRVGVARGLAVDPNILLMDEPFGAVDPIVRADLQQELLRLQRELDKTVVFVTHDIDEAFLLGDQVVILEKGARIAQKGSPEEILANPASDFVASFIGADRGKRSLSIREVDGSSILVDGDGNVAGALTEEGPA